MKRYKRLRRNEPRRDGGQAAILTILLECLDVLGVQSP